LSISILLLILTVYIVRPGDWIAGFDIRWNLILNAAGSAALMGLLVTGKARESWDRSWAYLLAFFFLMMISSIVMGQIDTIPLYAPQMLTNILVFFLICSAAQSRRQLDLITGVFTALAVFVAYQCHLQITDGTNIAGYGPLLRRAESFDEEGFLLRSDTFQALWLGVFEDPNDTGLLLVTLLPLMAAKAVFLNKGLIARLVPAATSACLVYGVYLTNSRGTFVALLGSISYFFILKYRSVKGLVAAALGGFLLITVGPSRMASVTSADDAAMERVYAWIEALWAFYLYPFFGLGPKHWADWHHKTTHNSFVLAFVENGFVAYVCWLAVIIIPLYAVSRGAFTCEDDRRRNEYAAYAACLAGVMLSIFFISRTYVLIPYFITACVLTHCRLAEPDRYRSSLNDATPIRLAAVAASSIVLIWIVNILTTRLML
jgi:putative inorganic carbon (HCO3(-)) transporter